MMDTDEFFEKGIVIIILLCLGISCVGNDIVKLVKSAKCEESK